MMIHCALEKKRGRDSEVMVGGPLYAEFYFIINFCNLFYSRS